MCSHPYLADIISSEEFRQEKALVESGLFAHFDKYVMRFSGPVSYALIQKVGIT